jgi:lysine 2,3-aminomutase
MAGQRQGVFKEKLSTFLRRKYEEAKDRPGRDGDVARMIERQYLYDEREEEVAVVEKRRHYEAEIHRTFQGKPLRGIEKLYRRTVIIEPTTICAAHCRWCLRGRYDILNLSEDELVQVARYCGEAKENRDVREVLITGGDPLMIPDRLEILLNALVQYAPNVDVFRVGTRVPLHDPARVDDRLLDIVARYGSIRRLELGIQVNHCAELFPEVEEAIGKLKRAGVTVYDQSVLLRDLNDSIDVLATLTDRLRYLGVEAHYLFHCVPLRGMHHHRTSVSKGLQLVRQLTSSGYASGRCKPMYTLMTDVGKVTLYEGTILKRERGRLLLQTHYVAADRKAWNPSWSLPDSAYVDEDGYLRVWYLDGSDD